MTGHTTKIITGRKNMFGRNRIRIVLKFFKTIFHASFYRIKLKNVIMKLSLAISALCILAMSFTNKSENNPVKENEAIARELMKAWDSHDTDKLCSLFADEFVYTEMASGNCYSTKNTLSNYFNGTIAGIPDTKVEIVTVLANEKFAAVE